MLAYHYVGNMAGSIDISESRVGAVADGAGGRCVALEPVSTFITTGHW